MVQVSPFSQVVRRHEEKQNPDTGRAPLFRVCQTLVKVTEGNQ